MHCKALTRDLKPCRKHGQRFCHQHAELENPDFVYNLLINNMTPYLSEKKKRDIICCLQNYTLSDFIPCIERDLVPGANMTRIGLMYELLVLAGLPPLTVPRMWKRLFRNCIYSFSHLETCKAAIQRDAHLFKDSPLDAILNGAIDTLKILPLNRHASVLTSIIELRPLAEQVTWNAENYPYELSNVRDAARAHHADIFAPLRDELQSVAWEPSRAVEWCFPQDDYREVRESFRL
jgi:hypothetical protein